MEKSICGCVNKVSINYRHNDVLINTRSNNVVLECIHIESDYQYLYPPQPIDVPKERE